MGYGGALLATVFWAGNFIVARGFSEDIPPVGLSFWRWAIAVLVLLPFALRAVKNDWLLVRKNILYLSITGLIGITLFNTLIYVAGHTTQALNLSLIATSTPIFVLILSRLIHGEIITGMRMVGVVIVLTGVLILITDGSIDRLARVNFAEGDLYMLLAAILFASYALLVKRRPPEMQIKTFTFLTFTIGLVFLVPLYALETWIFEPVIFNANNLMALLYVGVFASAIAFLSWNHAIATIGPSRTAMMYYLIPVFTGLAAWVLLAEDITLIHLTSMLLIIVGIVIANRSSNPK